MSTCRLEPEYIKNILSIIENYLFFEGTIDLSNQNDISKLEQVVISEMQLTENTSDFSEFSLKNYISESQTFFKPEIEAIFEMYGVRVPASLVGTPSMHFMKTNVSSNFNTFQITDKFHTLPLTKLGFDNHLNKFLSKATFLGNSTDTKFVSTNEEVTANLNNLKAELFDKIQDFLISKDIIRTKSPLYNADGSIKDYNHYVSIMKKLDTYFFSGKYFQVISGYDNISKVPNIEDSDLIDPEIKLAYYNGIILNNFDTVVTSTDLIDVNYKQYNNLWSDPSFTKYKKKFEGLKTLYFKDDTQESEGAYTNETKLLQLIITSIPAYNKKGNPTGDLLELKHFYLFSAKVNDFELLYGNQLKAQTDSNFIYFNENPVNALKWYIDGILDADPQKNIELKNYFNFNKEFAYSIKNFLESPEYNIKTKESNSDESITQILTQILNNSFGAAYITYNSSGKYILRSAYAQNFNMIRVQDNVFNKMYNNSSKTLYNPEKDLEKFKELLEGLQFDNWIENLNQISISKKNAIIRFLGNKTGIYLNYNSFEDFITDLAGGKALTTEGFINEIKDLLTNLSIDFEIVKAEITAEKITSISRGDNSTSEYIANTIKDNAFIALANSYLLNTVVKPLMNLKTLTGETIPTFKLANTTYKDTTLFQQQREKELSNPTLVYRSLLLSSKPAIVGTNTKLELNNRDYNKAAAKFNVSESYLSEFQYGFLQNILNNNQFDLMLGDYSDKSTVLTKLISASFEVNNTKVIEMSVTDIQNLVRNQSRNYYRDLMRQVINDYARLLDIPLSTTTVDITKSLQLINQRLADIQDITSLSVKASKLGIQFTKELHYSIYNNKPRLNQLIIDNFNIFENDELFKEFIKQQETQFVTKFKKYNKSTNPDRIKFVGEMDMSKVLKALNLQDSQFDKVEENKSEVDYFKLLNNAGSLNPLLKKWMWVNALFRNEYMYISGKGEYMHAAKKLRDRSADTALNWEEYLKESSERLRSMAKRNVMFTSTIEIPPRKTRSGIPENINHAVIEDFTANLHNISGNTHKQDAHDGSSFINYIYSKLVDNSYPGKGYNGTKKPFGTFVTDYGVVIKKDAESVITNDKIRNSNYSTIKYRNKQKQMLSIPIGTLKMKLEIHPSNQFYIQNGLLQQITKVAIDGNNIQLELKAQQLDGSWKSTLKSNSFNNLYQLWEMFGGEYSTDQNKIFNEGSNDLLYQIVTTADDDGNYILKDKLIHIISNASAVKAGGTNINSRATWKTDEELAYATFKNRFMGPQLNAGHETNASEIKEITQVISALAQNPATANLAQEAYEDIANIIKRAMKPYLKYLSIGQHTEVLNTEELYTYIAERFVNTLNNTKGDNIAKILVHSFSEDTKIPFSNQNFYVSFVRDIITKMNNEFITRYYSGTGAVLIPSHGIIQVFEDELGNISLQEDLIRKAFNSEFIDGIASNEEIIQRYIDSKYTQKDTTWDNVEIGDTILIDELVEDFDPYAILPDDVGIEKIPKPWRSNPKKINTAYNFSLNSKPKEIFQVVQDLEDGYYSVHFKTTDRKSLTEDEKERLIYSIYAWLPPNAKLSTWDEEKHPITKGGLAGLNRFNKWLVPSKETRIVHFEGKEIEVPVFERKKILIQTPITLDTPELYYTYKNKFKTGHIGNEDTLIKEGVTELFESNPELANSVYEVMGLTAINESEITYTDEEGNLCAKMGGRSSKFTKGSQWELVKDLKGYPSHSQGGVDIKLGKNGFSFTRNSGVIEAKHGLVLPKIK